MSKLILLILASTFLFGCAALTYNCKPCEVHKKYNNYTIGYRYGEGPCQPCYAAKGLRANVVCNQER